MKILNITKEDLNDDNEYVGLANVSDFDGSIQIAARLGIVRFKGSLRVKSSILAMPGSGIRAGEGIAAGGGIRAGLGIEAGSGIRAGLGIEAGLSISAKWISAKLRIFAGLCLYRLPKPDEAQVRAELRAGVIAFGEHVPPVTDEAPA